MKTRLLAAVILLLSFHRLYAASAVDATWTAKDTTLKIANATLGPSAISITNITNPSIGTADFSTAEYSAAPLPAGSSALSNYAVGSNYTATFSLPVTGLLIYAQFWNGNVGGITPIKYTFSQPFEILSGFDQATVTGKTLSLPAFKSGILRFPGPISTLSVSMNTSNTGGQIMSFGVVPISTTLKVDGPAKPATKKNRYTLTGTASATYGIKSVKIKVGNGSFVPVTGTAKWRYSVKLAKPAGKKKKTQTKVQIQATSNENVVSTIKRVVITRRK